MVKIYNHLILKLNQVDNPNVPKSTDGASLNQYIRSYSLNQVTDCYAGYAIENNSLCKSL